MREEGYMSASPAALIESPIPLAGEADSRRWGRDDRTCVWRSRYPDMAAVLIALLTRGLSNRPPGTIAPSITQTGEGQLMVLLKNLVRDKV